MPSWTTMNDLATGDLLTEADMDAIRGNIEYLLAPNNTSQAYDNGADYSTTSTSWVDVDSTNLKLTLTTNGGPVLIVASFFCSGRGYFDIKVDDTSRLGADSPNDVGLAYSDASQLPIIALATGLEAGTHTFTLQYKQFVGTSGPPTIYSNTEEAVMMFAVEL